MPALRAPAARRGRSLEQRACSGRRCSCQSPSWRCNCFAGLAAATHRRLMARPYARRARVRRRRGGQRATPLVWTLLFGVEGRPRSYSPAAVSSRRAALPPCSPGTAGVWCCHTPSPPPPRRRTHHARVAAFIVGGKIILAISVCVRRRRRAAGGATQRHLDATTIMLALLPPAPASHLFSVWSLCLSSPAQWDRHPCDARPRSRCVPSGVGLDSPPPPAVALTVLLGGRPAHAPLLDSRESSAQTWRRSSSSPSRRPASARAVRPPLVDHPAACCLHGRGPRPAGPCSPRSSTLLHAAPPAPLRHRQLRRDLHRARARGHGSLVLDRSGALLVDIQASCSRRRRAASTASATIAVPGAALFGARRLRWQSPVMDSLRGSARGLLWAVRPTARSLSSPQPRTPARTGRESPLPTAATHDLWPRRRAGTQWARSPGGRRHPQEADRLRAPREELEVTPVKGRRSASPGSALRRRPGGCGRCDDKAAPRRRHDGRLGHVLPPPPDRALERSKATSPN